MNIQILFCVFLLFIIQAVIVKSAIETGQNSQSDANDQHKENEKGNAENEHALASSSGSNVKTLAESSSGMANNLPTIPETESAQEQLHPYDLVDSEIQHGPVWNNDHFFKEGVKMISKEILDKLVQEVVEENISFYKDMPNPKLPSRIKSKSFPSSSHMQKFHKQFSSHDNEDSPLARFNDEANILNSPRTPSSSSAQFQPARIIFSPSGNHEIGPASPEIVGIAQEQQSQTEIMPQKPAFVKQKQDQSQQLSDSSASANRMSKMAKFSERHPKFYKKFKALKNTLNPFKSFKPVCAGPFHCFPGRKAAGVQGSWEKKETSNKL